MQNARISKSNIVISTAKGLLIIVLIVLLQMSCKKFVETPPPNGLITENIVYNSDPSAISVMTSIFAGLNSSQIQGNSSISLFAGLAADEFTLYSGVSDRIYNAYYKNALAANEAGFEHWDPLYKFIFKCNAAIDGLTKSTNLTLNVKNQLLGESKFMRGFFYFYLVNLFGDVPLALTTDPQKNTILARTPKTQVYEQIISDLKEAKELLSENYLDATLFNSTTERVRPTKWAASALLARVYLFYSSDYNKAEAEATNVINSSFFGPLPALKDAFLKNSREAIWQVQPINVNFNTPEARTLVITTNGPNSNNNPAYLSSSLLNSFDSNDQRALDGNWINSVTVAGNTYRYPFKYKLNSLDPTITVSTGTKNMKEYFMVLRLGEQYLIRAEARARLGNIAGAQSDLNTIRTRAGLNPTIANDQASLLISILTERRHELFSEWGHRWLDLKRTGKVDEVMTIETPSKANGASWQSHQQLYPISLIELQKAPNLVQNLGY